MPKACWTCRSRTVRCDESGIPCRKCEKAGLECRDRKPLRWVQGMAVRGKMRGRMYESILVKNKDREPMRLKTEQVSSIEDSPQFALQDPRIHHLDRSSRYYIDYYNERVCKLYILHDSDNNPLRHLIPYALDDVALLKSITALAARHFANTGHSFDQADAAVIPRYANANLGALLLKSQAIQILGAKLANPEPCSKDTVMATILLLIFIELLESGLDGWTFHLNGARGLSRLYRSLSQPGDRGGASNGSGEMDQDTRSFLARQYSLIDTLGGALSHPKPLRELSTSYDATVGQESIVRSFLGCPEFLLKSINFFSNQRRVTGRLPHGSIAIQEHVQDTVAMLDLTQRFDSLKWASGFHPASESSTPEIRNLSMLSEAYKTAALLYGRQVLGTIGSELAVPQNGELVSQLLGCIDGLKGEEPFFKCLLWPTFVAGLHCLEHDQQETVTDALRILWNSTNCLNVINASNILKDVWERVRVSGTQNKWSSGLAELDRHWLLI
ncbi:fungal-specific transcription factor domain-containing protein [Aspergillus pseudoustus]|uniref:Fungal-specific transcription factor domain-containing protein n=1 Tax=Aspergillus pseudoustus TaxID=1810923 RepID=A0ABR4K7V8_9EURO